MDNKTKFLIKILIVSGICIWIGWELTSRFGEIADPKYIQLIITTAVFLAGFGLISMNNKDSVFFVNVKQIISWSILSIISSFAYLVFETSPEWSRVLFKISSAFLFFTIALVLILVLFHDNEYLKELEIKEKKSKAILA